MADFTAKELETYLEDNSETLFDYKSPWNGIDEMDYRDGTDGTVEVPGFGKLELVENFGGEGMGDQMWVVFKVGDRMFRMNGYYDSWNGGEWDGSLEEVEAREVKVTQYFPKKEA